MIPEFSRVVRDRKPDLIHKPRIEVLNLRYGNEYQLACGLVRAGATHREKKTVPLQWTQTQSITRRTWRSACACFADRKERVDVTFRLIVPGYADEAARRLAKDELVGELVMIDLPELVLPGLEAGAEIGHQRRGSNQTLYLSRRLRQLEPLDGLAVELRIRLNSLRLKGHPEERPSS